LSVPIRPLFAITYIGSLAGRELLKRLMLLATKEEVLCMSAGQFRAAHNVGADEVVVMALLAMSTLRVLLQPGGMWVVAGQTGAGKAIELAAASLPEGAIARMSAEHMRGLRLSSSGISSTDGVTMLQKAFGSLSANGLAGGSAARMKIGLQVYCRKLVKKAIQTQSAEQLGGSASMLKVGLVVGEGERVKKVIQNKSVEQLADDTAAMLKVGLVVGEGGRVKEAIQTKSVEQLTGSTASMLKVGLVVGEGERVKKVIQNKSVEQLADGPASMLQVGLVVGEGGRVKLPHLHQHYAPPETALQTCKAPPPWSHQ
jgi:hypothetical protein